MKRIRKFLRKVCTVTGAIVLLLIALGIVGHYVNHPKVPNDVVLGINMDQADEGKGGGLLSQLLPGESPVNDIISAIDRARRDDRVHGLVMYFGNSEPALAEAQEMRDALLRFKAAGKFTLAYAHSFGELTPATRSYYLASTADEVWLQPLGLVGLNGIAFQVPFFRSLLDEYGVKPEFVQRKGYKTAMASLTDTDFTAQHREMMTVLLQDITGQIADGIAANRKLPVADVTAILGTGPLVATDALQKKLIDKIAYQDELNDYIKTKAGDKTKPMKLLDYLNASDSDLPKGFDHADDSKGVAIVSIDGMIHSGESVHIPGRESAGALTIVNAIEQAAKKKDIKAVIIRIDSPGGSAVASETIRRAVVKANETKPVVVSMGALAASGGYWIATGAPYIIAEPATLTGSIGVIAGKASGADLLKRFHINLGEITAGQNSNMWSPAEGFTPEQRALLESLTDGIYDGFKDRVMEGRKLDAATVENIAQGRVWTGKQALDLKLVDELGGMHEALNYARGKIGLATDTPVIVTHLPTPESRREQLMHLLGMLQTSVGALPAIIDNISGVVSPQTLQADIPTY